MNDSRMKDLARAVNLKYPYQVEVVVRLPATG